ncbi:MAG: pyruvate dehydrogenase (acetyl-transferring) E1 component subunit alpha, partial [Pseudonocardiales bacterium]
VLIEACTYRMDAHTTSDDPTRYQVAGALEEWKLKDPLERVRVHLVREGLAESEFFDGLAAEADELAVRLRNYCISMPAPGPERIFSNVYAESTPALESARDDSLAYHASFTDVGSTPGSRH